jgi:glycosyltransferase involved in cell wall biosynthesis
MTEDPLVSVVIPVYNGERYLRRTLESALAQTYNPLEVIVVDDGSTDGSPDIITTISARDSRMRSFRKKNGGVASARNYGISQARGNLIATMDGDDLWHPGKIARQVSVLNALPANVGLVYCWAIEIDEDDAVIPPARDIAAKQTFRGHVTTELAIENFVETSSIPLFRRAFFERVGGYDVELPQGAEDWKLYLALSEICEFEVIPEYLVGYRQYSASLSRDASGMAASQDGVIRWLTEKWPSLPEEIKRERTYRADCYLATKALSNNKFRQAVYFRARAHKARPEKLLGFENIAFAARLLLRTIGLSPGGFRHGRSAVSFQDFIATRAMPRLNDGSYQSALP